MSLRAFVALLLPCALIVLFALFNCAQPERERQLEFISLGCAAPPVAMQLIEQGIEMDAASGARFEQDRMAICRLYMGRLITGGQANKAYQKLAQKISKHKVKTNDPS